MKIDPSILKQLLSQKDDVLWQTVRTIAASGGMNLAESTPSSEEMRRLRTTLSGLGSLDSKEAERIISEWRKRGGGHG